MLRKATFTALALGLVACGAPDNQSAANPTQAAACDRACAIAAAHTVLARPTALPDSVRTTQNTTITNPADIWLTGASNIDVHGEFADASGSQALLFGTGTGADGADTVFGLRIALANGEPTEVEVLTAIEGEASLSPREIPIAAQGFFNEPVPEEARTSPERMIELANIYFDGIENNNGDALPVTEDCERVENGIMTTSNPRFSDIKCNSLEPFVYIPEVVERRYPVVDVEHGVVVGIVAFQIPGGDYERQINGETVNRHYDPRALYLMEAFKIIDGEVRHIEATMRNLPYGTQLNWPLEN